MRLVAGSRVRVVLRGRGELYVDVIPGTILSGPDASVRWPLAPWGVGGTLSVPPEDVLEVEVLGDLDGRFVASIAAKQRAAFGKAPFRRHS